MGRLLSARNCLGVLCQINIKRSGAAFPHAGKKEGGQRPQFYRQPMPRHPIQQFRSNLAQHVQRTLVFAQARLSLVPEIQVRSTVPPHMIQRNPHRRFSPNSQTQLVSIIHGAVSRPALELPDGTWSYRALTKRAAAVAQSPPAAEGGPLANRAVSPQEAICLCGRHRGPFDRARATCRSIPAFR